MLLGRDYDANADPEQIVQRFAQHVMMMYLPQLERMLLEADPSLHYGLAIR